MSGLIEWLEKLNMTDGKVRAILRRSLAFNPEQHVPAYPYIEPFLKGDVSRWLREMHYLVAGLWALHWREGREGTPLPIGKACALFDSERRSSMSNEERHQLTSTEKRFVALLDADADQLRQMISLLKEQSIDFEHLLTGLLRWHDEHKRTQNQWARDFYQYSNYEQEPDSNDQKEHVA